MSMKPEATIYTDGSCLGNPGPGGWAAVVKVGSEERKMSGGASSTTNNRMELTGVINGLNSLRGPHIVTVYSDSQYLIRAFNEHWVDNWKRRGWTKADGELKNRDLWQLLDKLAQKHSITWVWVKGHAGNKYNEICDKLAVSMAKQFERGEIPSAEMVFGAEVPDEAIPAQEPTTAEAAEPVQEQTTLMDCQTGPLPEEEPPVFAPTPEPKSSAEAETVMVAMQQYMEEMSVKMNGIPHPCGGEPWCGLCAAQEPVPGQPMCAKAYMAYLKDFEEGATHERVG